MKPLVLLCLMAAVLAAKEKPRFKFSQTSKILLPWFKTWEVGSSNMFSFLNPDQRLKIKVIVEGNSGTGLRRILQFKCRQQDAERTLDMESLTTTSNERQCDTTIPFLIKLTKESNDERNSEFGKEFEFTLLSSNLPYTQAFTQKLELSVRIEHSSGTLVSNSLFVWNLGAIGTLNSEKRSGEAYATRFLTKEAVEFLKRMDMPNEEFGSIQFLDPEMSKLITSAPDFFKSKINVGAVVNFDAGTCESYQILRSSLFGNYHSKLDERNQNLLKHMYLDMEEGRLHYSTYGLSSAITEFFYSKDPSWIGICATLSFAGLSYAYGKTYPIQQRIWKSDLAYKTFGARSSNCKIFTSVMNRTLNIFSGMDYTPLICPILCSDPNQVYRFYHGDISLVPDTRRDWTEVDGILIAKPGNIIEFPDIIYKKHYGDYRCEAGGQVFTFKTRVVSMPQFSLKSQGSVSSPPDISGSLPPTVFAMEGESLSYSCSAYFTNVHSTTVKPVFYTIGGSDNKWRSLSMEEFNTLIAPSSGTAVVSQEASSQAESITLTLNVDAVPPALTSRNLDFTHRYVCNASVDKSDAEMIGMPSYSVQSGSNVFFVSRPVLSSFDLSMAKNCSAQNCSSAQGAYFQFALKPDVVTYLNKIGATITGYFKIDDSYLNDVRVFSSKDAAEIAYDNVTMKLTFNVKPITRADVLKELQSRKTLTPVFNFRYKEGSNLAHLRMLKDKHGPPDAGAGMRDCRVDPLCFYSTDFDAKTSLRSLALALEFQGEPVAEPEAYATGTSMIVAIFKWLLSFPF